MRKLFVADVARMRGVEEVTVRAYRSRGRLPEPDGYEMAGHIRRPWWWENTLAYYLQRETPRPAPEERRAPRKTGGAVTGNARGQRRRRHAERT